ncbi:peptide chain release factor N(5)-glutamine methyltransferase [Hyunsoonleella sp. SJ7]|uniref:Release factor glutamine methyltransferase n=1 Tax=Hyunsoonleella aquatilis TaxID=2762758 RepID=A0A923KH56_9FLAO|nr:peptide chain release factor N(5)-glutamine methyltransferase [Hyunsoonleella aquatilis]MBC3759756.1 peptide chain release factor N(5)-glutamine methyltransferase [Hyunsoonleella aquatilis]
MMLKEVQARFHSELSGLYEKEEIDSFFYQLIEKNYEVDRIRLALEPDIAIEHAERILESLQFLKQHKPIQYIIGETEFYGLKFKVNENVLIPRPETEELVEWIIDCHSEYFDCAQHGFREESKIRILDIGTGSGCIAVSLAKNLQNAKVYALDVSEKALEVAKENADLNAVDVIFIKADILSLENRWNLGFYTLEFDIIVSNPPYVRELEKNIMKPNVLDNEPHLALFVKDQDPLLFYRAISEFSKTALNENGQLFFEINEYLGQETVALLEQKNYNNIELRKDIFGKDRMVKAEY